jgi:hypothetical protein
MAKLLDYNEVFQFMREFGINVINQWNELIIDAKWNIYTNLDLCENTEEVKARVIFALCRPIGKGLEVKDANRLLHKVNKYFKVNLTRKDMRLIYTELCYSHKFDEFKEFIQEGFPMEKLEKAEG